jgi:hypothetical protein
MGQKIDTREVQANCVPMISREASDLWEHPLDYVRAKKKVRLSRTGHATVIHINVQS